MAFGNSTCKEIVENICPYCNEHLIINKRSFANHVRWCKSNPKYQEILNSTKEKVSKKSKEYFNNKYGKIKEFKVNCSYCEKEFIIKEREYKFDINKKYYCSKSCASSSHKLNDNQKQNISNGVKNFLKSNNPNYICYKDIIKICPICGKEYVSKYNTCSQSCGAKFRYIKNLDNNQINIKFLYKHYCNFKFSLNDFPNEFNFNLIKKNGWYKAINNGNNLNGVSRDHKFSCNEGFNQLIDPYIISHPANCQLLIHNDNISKLDKCSITLENLIKNIKIWNNKYGKYPNKIDYYLFDKLNIKFKIYFD